ncbi:S8 family serine peptidase [Fuchsiella alkaliacetigena]|uniref:S8 family serine peptidase n=1 Tax=Fuchsiella alkaliacetigena TaxID=957042 RepID=UPI00200A2C1D|nr:S8 family serine peptidase [Fuchsiella alkaliacetigena]MCK8825958.1 S8 family serine peptidase [Fuchsiella alkaliacetigena]
MNNKLFKLILITIITILSITACSRSSSITNLTKKASIYGQIEDGSLLFFSNDDKANYPIVKATVYLDNNSTTTDSKGQYYFENLRAGTYTWQVKAEGYQSAQIKVNLAEGDNKLINKSLLPTLKQKTGSISGQIKIHNTTENKVKLNSSQFKTKTEATKIKPLSEYQESEIIVKFNSLVAERLINSLKSKYNLDTLTQLELNNGLVANYKVPENKSVLEMAAQLESLPIVNYAVPNYLFYTMEAPDDPHYQYQWGHLNSNLEAAWNIQRGNKEVTVAVIDSGIIPQHPDLKQNLLMGYDFVENNEDPTDQTPAKYGGSHGTHVAGIIGATTNNQLGVAGVNWQLSLLPVRALGPKGSGSTFDVAQGIDYAVQQGADIINLSLGGPASPIMEESIKKAVEAGVTVIAAAGNDSANYIVYPAAYEDVIAVGAVEKDNQRSNYSNTGSELEIVAPGSNILSTWGYYENGVVNTGYRYMSGTSMATPYVSGTAALLVAQGITKPEDIRARLTSTTMDLGTSGWNEKYGYGLVDAYGALLGQRLESPKVLALIKKEDIFLIVDKVQANQDGSYKLTEIAGQEIYLAGWRDTNNNGIVDSGDYFGISDEAIKIEENEEYSFDLDIYLY